MSKAERETFLNIDLTPPRLAGIKASPENIEEALKRAAERAATERWTPPPFIVSPKTFQQWKDEGLIKEHPVGSDNWVFAFELETKE